MDNNCHIPDLVKAFSYIEKWWMERGFIANSTSHLYGSLINFRYIDNDGLTKQTDIIGKKYLYQLKIMTVVLHSFIVFYLFILPFHEELAVLNIP